MPIIYLSPSTQEPNAVCPCGANVYRGGDALLFIVSAWYHGSQGQHQGGGGPPRYCRLRAALRVLDKP